VAIHEILSPDFQEMRQRRADLVLDMADGSILNIEFQSENDDDMPYRMAMYAVMIGKRYRRSIRQIVLYVGQERLRMDDSLDLGTFQIRYTLVDIREFDAEELMRTGDPGDLALAVLARGGTDRLFDIARGRALTQIALLGGLRKLPEDLKMELRNMSSLLKDHWLVRELYDEALEKGETKGKRKAARNSSVNSCRISSVPCP
jgi:predicted transposase YdaD